MVITLSCSGSWEPLLPGVPSFPGLHMQGLGYARPGLLHSLLQKELELSVQVSGHHCLGGHRDELHFVFQFSNPGKESWE